jgi:hypothetical protein
MKAIWALILLTLPIGCRGDSSASHNAQQTTDATHVIRLFPTATEVRLFVDTGRNDSNLHPILTLANGRKLSVSQREKLENSLVWNENYGKELVAACFMPHHFFRYFDSKHRKLGEIAVCFCCGGVEVDKADGTAIYPETRLNAHYAQLKALVREMHEPTDIECSPNDG